MHDIIYKIDRNPLVTGLVCAGFLVFYLFLNAMTLPLDHNEHMYVTAGHLMKSNELYRDFAFLQMPYLPILYDAVFRVFQVDHLLLASRLCSLFFAIACCVAMWLIIYKETKNYAVSHLSTLIFGLSYFIQDISVEAANYMMPMCATLFAVLLYQDILENPELRLPKMYCLGLILALAAGTKLYYSAFFIPFLGCSAVYPLREDFSRKLIYQTAPLVVGFTVGLIPVIHYVSNYPEAFWFNNITYHFLNLQWRGFDPGLNIGYRIDSFLKVFLDYPSNLAFAGIVILIALNCLKASDSRKRIGYLDQPVTTLSFMLLIVGICVAITPLPIFMYYFAAAFPFAVIFGCCLLKRAPISCWSSFDKALVSVGILVMIGSASVTFSQRFGTFTRFGSWTPIQVHSVAHKIRSELGSQFGVGKMATLSPLYAVEAKLPIYPQFSTGPFVFRIGTLLSTHELDVVKGVSSQTLDRLFTKEPPAAIIVGNEPTIEASLEAHGKNNGSRETIFGSLTLFSTESQFSPIREPLIPDLKLEPRPKMQGQEMLRPSSADSAS